MIIFHRSDIKNLIVRGIDGINPYEKKNISVDYVRKNYPNLVIRGVLTSLIYFPMELLNR